MQLKGNDRCDAGRPTPSGPWGALTGKAEYTNMALLLSWNDAMPIAISVVMITRDAAATLARALEATRGVDEVVIYDNGSTDDTREIAAGYPNVSLHRGPFEGFGTTRRRAVACARNDWIFSLDADESPDADLIAALERWLPTADPESVGVIHRQNWLMGRPVRRAGWGHDWLVRVFNRRHCNFNDARVHESVATHESTRPERLAGHLTHQAVTDLSQFLEKINRYSELRARSGRLKHYPVPLIFLKALFAFFRTYALQGGFLEGWRGLVIAVANANGVFWKYLKARIRPS